jgi:DNA-binding MarR family transcriptional regulator
MSKSIKRLRSAVNLKGTGHCACFNFRKTARALTQLYDTGLQSSGIRATQFAVLVGIAKSEPVPIGRLAQLLILDRSTLSRSLRLLTAMRLIAVSPRSAMRQRFVTLLPAGWKALLRSLPLWRETQRIFVGQIGEEYWNSLQKELDKLSAVALDLEPSDTAVHSNPRRSDAGARQSLYCV